MRESKSIDFLVIAALEEERDAMLDLLGEYEKLDKEGDIYTTYLSSVQSNRKDKSIFSIAVVCPLNMGPINAATLANSATRKWNPQFVILMGIALGVEGEVNHGDVMISTQVADYTLGKIKDGERAIRWEVFPSGPSLIDSANNLRKDWSDSIPKKHPANKTCSKFKGVIASGGDVISDDQVVSSYSKNWPKLIGIEMESGGVASGVHQTPSRPEFIMIKSVSDFGKDKHDPEVLPFRAYASYSSATFVLELIKSGPATSITKSVSVKADKENKNEELKRAERRWTYIQNHEIQKFEFKFLLKNEVGKDWLLRTFKDIKVFISRDKKGLSLQDILSLSEKPNTVENRRKLDKPISSFWQLYEKEIGFWCKRIKPQSEIPELVAGFDCEFPFSLLEENKLILQNLAGHDDIGVSFPPSIFQAGIEEIKFTISGDSFHFPIYISDEKSLDMYHTMAATFQGFSQKPNEPISFAFAYQGFQLLEMFHKQILPRKEDEKKFEKRSPFGAQSGPNGISISFYPSIPKSFDKSEESKEYSFTIQNNSIDYSKIEKELRLKIESGSYERQDFLNLCSLLSVQHRFNELLEMARTEENLNGELPTDMYIFRGSAYLNLGRYEEALTDFTSINDVSDSERSKSLILQSFCYRELDNLSESLRCINEAIEIEPKNAEYHSLASRTLASIDKIKEGIKKIKDAIRIDSNELEYQILLGQLLRMNGENIESEKVLHKALDLSSDSHELYHQYAITLSENEKLDDASNNFRKSLDIRKTSLCYEDWGRMLCDNNDWDTAKKVVSEGLELYKFSYALNLYMGVILANLNMITEGLEYLETAKKIDPSEKAADTVIAQIKNAIE